MKRLISIILFITAGFRLSADDGYRRNPLGVVIVIHQLTTVFCKANN